MFVFLGKMYFDQQEKRQWGYVIHMGTLESENFIQKIYSESTSIQIKSQHYVVELKL